MKKLFALLMSVIMVIACFAACGNDTPDVTEPDQLEQNDPANQTNQNEPDDKPEEKKTVVVGYTIYKPMNYKDEDGKLVGFDTELAEAVFGNLGYEVVFQQIDWTSRYTDLNSGAIDCVWNGFTANVADDDDGILRSEKVDFSFNYMENRQVIVVKSDSGISSAADLNGKIGGVESGSAGESYASGFEGAIIKGFDYQTTALFELLSGSVDFAVLDAQLAKSYCGKGDYEDLMILEELSSDVEYYAIGFKKGSELTALVNAQLEALAADGTISAIAEKYDVVNTTITDFSDQK